jgi:hypothetical protein
MVTVRLNASEIAVITGHNTYQNITELTEKILIRNRLKRGVLIKNDIQKKILSIQDEKILETIKKELKLSPTTTKKELETHIHKKYIAPLTTIKKEQDSHKQLDALLQTLPVTKKILSTSAYTELIKNRGTEQEQKSLDTSEKKNKVHITARNNKLYCKPLFEDDCCTIILQGKIDGMLHDDTVVESKNRSRRLFYRIPKYEQVQLEAYMFLTGTKTALHIENYNELTNESYYYHDDLFWTECKQKLIDFTIDMIQSL